MVRRVGSALLILACLAQAEGSEEDSPCTELNVNYTRARHWATVWAGIWGGLAVGQGVLALTTSDPTQRGSWWVDASGSLLGLVPTLLLPPKRVADARNCATHVEAAPAQDDLLLRDRLLFYEKEESWVTGFAAHLFNALANMMVASVIEWGYGQTAFALASLGGGMALGEAMILTYPGDALRPEKKNEVAVGWEIHPYPRGFSASVTVTAP